MDNGTHAEQLGASIHHLLDPNQQGSGIQFGLDNTYQKVEIPQTIDFYMDEKTIRSLHAEKGNATAQYNLGLEYYKGEKIAQDYEKAVFWYQKSALQGYVNAQYNLGFVYHKGEGIEQNHKKSG
jgi:TPR repeat protein